MSKAAQIYPRKFDVCWKTQCSHTTNVLYGEFGEFGEFSGIIDLVINFVGIWNPIVKFL